ncbi:MAG TPA: tRNA (guanosine(37)-N1)-methyltransferase TrmD, partial [Burkholderiaceae bacterium]|nr:tRNA (guanosine(37)-N1)-methyltransferase TrmD [Burkholderiaceae bacterium]
YATDAYRRVDDRPFGGGPGMVMMAEPLAQAIEAARDAASGPARVVLMSPQGKALDHAYIARLASERTRTIVVCGRYEAIDERALRSLIDEELSLGDFVLSGGEIAAMALMDAVVRRLPGVLGDEQSAVQDSFTVEASGLLDCPHWTRPEVWRGDAVPEVLLSGHHGNIARWRRERALEATFNKRPDLIEKARALQLLSPEDEQFLQGLTLARDVGKDID